jgi:L-amino acid N-acyltransferase YncA
VIRPATPSDNAAIAAIWNREVLQTAATSDTEPRDPEAQRAWLAAHGPRHPVIPLHERRGFVRVGHERQVALKHGMWLDVVTLQRILSA